MSRSEPILSIAEDFPILSEAWQFLRNVCYRLFVSAFLTIIEVFKYFSCFLFLWFFVCFVFILSCVFLLLVQFLQDLLLPPNSNSSSRSNSSASDSLSVSWIYSLSLYLFISFFPGFLFFLGYFSLLFEVVFFYRYLKIRQVFFKKKKLSIGNFCSPSMNLMSLFSELTS